MAGPNMVYLNDVIDFIKDVVANDINYTIEDLYDIRVTCGSIIKDGDELFLLNSILSVLNGNLDKIEEINHILYMTLYCNNSVKKQYFSYEGNKIIYN